MSVLLYTPLDSASTIEIELGQVVGMIAEAIPLDIVDRFTVDTGYEAAHRLDAGDGGDVGARRRRAGGQQQPTHGRGA